MFGTGHVNILGTRGIPAAHGGFETFAERLALFLVSRGISVTVYCQSDRGEDLRPREDYWHGVHRVHIGTRAGGVRGTMAFDLACVRHVLNQPGVDLVLGYNTAVFNLLQVVAGRRVFMNMDGIEWKRAKWSLAAKAWFLVNETIGANLSHPIADHPRIADHVRRRSLRRSVMIPYGADLVAAASAAPVLALGLAPRRYFVSIARIEPENSILEIVRAHRQSGTDLDLVVLGRFDRANAYHRRVMTEAEGHAILPGAIYDDAVVKALRFHARAYFHGHQVGGTNPSLVESLGAGNAVIAHDNAFNRWTAGDAQFYFASVDDCARQIMRVATDELAVYRARMAARARHAADFRWRDVLAQYQALLVPAGADQEIAIPLRT